MRIIHINKNKLKEEGKGYIKYITHELLAVNIKEVLKGM